MWQNIKFQWTTWKRLLCLYQPTAKMSDSSQLKCFKVSNGLSFEIFKEIFLLIDEVP